MSHIGALCSLKPNSDLEAKFLGKRRDAALHELGDKNATTNIRMLILPEKSTSQIGGVEMACEGDVCRKAASSILGGRLV